MTLRLRAARSTDAGKLGAMITDAVLARPWKPRLHTGAEDIAHCGRMIDRGWVTVAVLEDRVAGFLTREGRDVHALFVASDMQGRGVGSALLRHAMQASDRLLLWTFLENAGALRFYDRHGFRERARGDGSDNDEGLPDIQLEWQAEPAKPEQATPEQATKEKTDG